MDISVKYKLKGDLRKLMGPVRKQVIAKLEPVVKGVVEEYIAELEAHMGTIPGATAYKDEEVSWAPLSIQPDKPRQKFWYETGETANAVIVNMRVSEKGISVFAGIPKTSKAFDKALWNELGFMPQDGDHLVRRPLFIPLAESHIEELNKRIADCVKNTDLRVTVQI